MVHDKKEKGGEPSLARDPPSKGEASPPLFPLKNLTPSRASRLFLQKRRPRRVLEDGQDTLARTRRALQVHPRPDPHRDLLALLGRDGPLTSAIESLHRRSVVPEVLLAADEDVGDFRVGAEVDDLGHPLLDDVVERVGLVDRETDQDDVRVWVGEWSEAVVVFLACCVP